MCPSTLTFSLPCPSLEPCGQGLITLLFANHFPSPMPHRPNTSSPFLIGPPRYHQDAGTTGYRQAAKQELMHSQPCYPAPPRTTVKSCM